MTDVPKEPLTTPDAWRGPEIQADPAWVHRLTDSEIAELGAALDQAVASGKDRSAWTRDDFPLPTLAPRIGEWMRELNDGRGFTLIKDFPVRAHSKEECADVYWGMGLHMGMAVPQNTDGDLLGHVRDVGADPNAYGVRLYKTRAEQDFHTDGADIIGLFCLRPAKSGGVSRIVSSVSVFNEILRRRPDLVPTLFESFPFDTQGQHAPGGQPWFDFPICHFAEGRLRTFFIPWYIRESQRHAEAPRLSAAQQACVTLIEEIANDPAFFLDMQFEPGDMQFLKNASILHKRTDYEDRDEPDEKRHLLRLWLTARDFSAGDEMLRRGVERREVTAASA